MSDSAAPPEAVPPPTVEATEASAAGEATASPPADGAAGASTASEMAAAAPATGETSEAMTLSAQTNQVESNTPIKDPATDVPHNLVAMDEMTKEILLDACKKRFAADGIYTFVADILVAINPYKWIDMYGKQYKERYSPANPLCPVPHVYAIAQAAAKNLRLLNRNQARLLDDIVLLFPEMSLWRI